VSGRGIVTGRTLSDEGQLKSKEAANLSNLPCKKNGRFLFL
jgi:hypothetical protein